MEWGRSSASRACVCSFGVSGLPRGPLGMALTTLLHFLHASGLARHGSPRVGRPCIDPRGWSLSPLLWEIASSNVRGGLPQAATALLGTHGVWVGKR